MCLDPVLPSRYDSLNFKPDNIWLRWIHTDWLKKFSFSSAHIEIASLTWCNEMTAAGKSPSSSSCCFLLLCFSLFKCLSSKPEVFNLSELQEDFWSSDIFRGPPSQINDKKKNVNKKWTIGLLGFHHIQHSAFTKNEDLPSWIHIYHRQGHIYLTTLLKSSLVQNYVPQYFFFLKPLCYCIQGTLAGRGIR